MRLIGSLVGPENGEHAVFVTLRDATRLGFDRKESSRKSITPLVAVQMFKCKGSASGQAAFTFVEPNTHVLAS